MGARKQQVDKRPERVCEEKKNRKKIITTAQGRLDLTGRGARTCRARFASVGWRHS